MIRYRLSPDMYERCWIPTRMEYRKETDKTGKTVETQKEKLLFPGYVFVSTDHPHEMHKALSVLVDYLKTLRSPDGYIPITPKEERVIRRLTGGGDRLDFSVGVIKDGELKVLRGPLVGMEKYVKKINRHKRKALMEMNLFGETQHFFAGLEIVEHT